MEHPDQNADQSAKNTPGATPEQIEPAIEQHQRFNTAQSQKHYTPRLPLSESALPASERNLTPQPAREVDNSAMASSSTPEYPQTEQPDNGTSQTPYDVPGTDSLTQNTPLDMAYYASSQPGSPYYMPGPGSSQPKDAADAPSSPADPAMDTTHTIPATGARTSTGGYASGMMATVPPQGPDRSNQPGNAYGGRNRESLAALLVIPLLALLIGGLGGWLIGTGSVFSNPGFTPLGGSTIEQVAAKFHTSVVEITAQSRQGTSLGSGVIIDKDGYIVTNNHVITGGHNLQVVLYDNTKIPAELTGTDPSDDLAVIKIHPPQHMSVAQIGDSSKLNVGQQVLAIGNPLGITQTVTNGIISALGRNVSEGQDHLIINAIQTDAPINPGNSGGALVGMQGTLIGIPTLVPIDPEFKTPAAGVGFAIPANRVKFIVPQLIKDGQVTNSGRADMGVQVISVDQTIANDARLPVNQGALIVDVVPDSAAAQAGLQRRDIIVQMDKQQIEGITSLQDYLVDKSPGNTVLVHIYRADQQMDVKVRLGERKVS
ncbi:S1C family serine protease [Dictyobacter arantiisoli]|uniref:PDZ domain-containing protein n=1 Tax=Dictyobacter arantiisoli TaxID=2014874 RepID=A0A5A5TCU8_9CHLR|nr:trypsin-like peptidase domain-containing protein [Dictyobacter arantiisoli]GCF08754.1 hypothetical protein KDI_23180 [Dictyobacter arantiisoli]